MSKTRLYQMYDLTAEAAAGPIISEKRDGPAIRAFTAVLADPKTLPGQYPDHFALLFLGEQDEDSSHISSITPVPILTGAAWLATQNGNNKLEDQGNLELVALAGREQNAVSR